MVSDLHLQPGQAPLASPRAVRAFSLTQDITYQNNIQQQHNDSQRHQNITHHQQAIQQTSQLKQQRPASAVQSSSSSDSDSSSEDEEDERLKQRRLQGRTSIACAELSEIAKQERSYHRKSPSHSSSNIARFIKQNSSDQCGITGRRDNTDKFHEWSDPIKLQVHETDTENFKDAPEYTYPPLVIYPYVETD